MKRVHYIAGITITIFITLHLFNHIYSLFGVMSHIEVMNSLRVFYRNTIVETLLLSAVLIQVISGVSLFVKKRKIANGIFARLQLWSGFYLAVFLVFHLAAVFIGRLVLHLDTNIYFGVAGLNTFPFSLFFIPYYGLAIISFFGHLAAIHYLKMNYTLFGITPNYQSYLILVAGIILSVVILYGLTNGGYGIDIPKAYHILVGK